jgi:nucleotide-binding universal stress UspA family protein
MREKMKVLIAYDGSEYADDAIESLQTAGLPQRAEVSVMSVADVFLPPALKEADMFPPREPEAVRRAHERAEQKLQEAEKMAKRASEQIKSKFREWQVSHEAVADSPAWALISKTDEWKPNLVVMGARGHSVLGGRLILGSVSQRVLCEAKCSVRIARGTVNNNVSPIRLLVGVDNSNDSNAAVLAVLNRDWPNGTELRLLAVVDTVMAVTPDPWEPSVMKWIEVNNEDNWDEVRQSFEPVAGQLRAAGLDARVMIRRGNPADEIVSEAESWGAHCVFLGAKGTRGIERLLLGSVSSAVSAGANCSVEVVRTLEVQARGRIYDQYQTHLVSH